MRTTSGEHWSQKEHTAASQLNNRMCMSEPRPRTYSSQLLNSQYKKSQPCVRMMTDLLLPFDIPRTIKMF